MDEIAAYLNDFDISDDTPEFDNCISTLLEIYDQLYDAPQPSFPRKKFVPQLTDAMHELGTFSAFAIFNHLLLDTGALKSICSSNWLQQSAWKPIATFPVPRNSRPFRFAGQDVHATHITYLIAKLYNNSGQAHHFCQVVFVPPSTPIPFLVGLEIARNMALNISVREGDGSHIHVTKWNTTFSITVHSHLWLPFELLKEKLMVDLIGLSYIKKLFICQRFGQIFSLPLH